MNFTEANQNGCVAFSRHWRKQKNGKYPRSGVGCKVTDEKVVQEREEWQRRLHMGAAEQEAEHTWEMWGEGGSPDSREPELTMLL